MGKATVDSGSGYRWSFIRIGGVDQVVLRNGDDIAHIPRLDQKLWAALAMPKKGAGLLPETLDVLDVDGDGRIRAPDINAAIDFASSNLVSLDTFLFPGETLRLADIKNGAVKESAMKALELAGNVKSQDVSLADVAAALTKFAKNRFNGDGVLTPGSAGSPALAAAVSDIVSAGYGTPDLGGDFGLAKAGFEAFLVDAKACIDWQEKGTTPEIAVLGEATDEAWNAFQAICQKVDDWFFRSQLVALSGSRTESLGQDNRLASLLSGQIMLCSPELLELPIAPASESMTLDLSGPLNPGWSQALHVFAHTTAPLRNTDFTKLDFAGWEGIKSRLAPYGAWIGSKPAVGAIKLGTKKLYSIIGTEAIATLPSLMEEDASKAILRNQILDLRKLLLLRRDLVRILRNFVNFSDFYSKRDGIFQAGRLYLDGRECELCIEVENPAGHATLDSMAGAYLAYCDCSQKDGSKKSIVAAFTSGDADHLFPGRNGIFYDRDGLDWDARIVRTVVQPISIREAFFSPYKWLAKTVNEMLQKRAATAESGVQNKLKGQAETAVGVAAGEKPEIPKKIDVGTVAAIGVALGSIGAMITSILGVFLGMGVWMPIGLLAVFLLISGPSMILAYLKLRKRNIGPILDAEGWAINGRLKINVPFGGTLTHLAALPFGSERQLQDPFGEKKRPWGLYLAILVVIVLALLWLFGTVDPILPPSIRFGTLIGR